MEWAAIAKVFEHIDEQGNMVRRSDNFIKNYWNNTVKIVIEEFLKDTKPDAVKSFDSISKYYL